MKKIFVLGMLVFQGMISSAQQGINLQVLTPPAPEVSALGKFGLMPVDNFTGVPSISIPVYTIKEGPLEFPISLEYHAGGIKVKEDASEVGLGWALSAAGSVVSVTRGRPDFAGGFASSYISVPDAPDVQLQTKVPAYSLNNWYYQWGSDLSSFGPAGGAGFVYSGLTLSKNGSIKEYYNQFTVGYDGQAPDFTSDLYSITIGNKFYRFVFDNNFKPVVLGDGCLKIEPISDGGTYPIWKVTDEKGIVYYFEQKQFNYSGTSYPANSGTAPELNTWHLTRIISPIYGQIDFNYQYAHNSFVEPVPNFSQVYLCGNISQHTQQVTNKIDAHYTMYDQLNLDNIQFSSGYVKFFYSQDRVDLKGGRRLTSIEVHDKNDQLVKKMNLDNNYYFNASSDAGGFPTYLNTGMFSTDNKTKRMKLNAITETDVTNASNVKRYTFTYNEQLNLPSKLSLAIDHWGYYNGASNTELVPPVTLISPQSGTPISYPGANRDANPAYMQANMLTSIQYPTGGTSSFTYETNQYPKTEMVTTWHDEISELYKAQGSAVVNNGGFVDAAGNFTVPDNWVGKTLQIVSLVTRDPSYSSAYTMDIIVKYNGSFLKRISTIPPAGSNMVIDASITLQSGNYNISYDVSTADFFNSYEIRRQVSVLSAYATTQQVQSTVYSAGLRTSKIVNVDPFNGNVNTKTFTYYNGTEDALPIYESAVGFDADNIGDGVGAFSDPSGHSLGNHFQYRFGQSIYPFSDGRNAPFFGYQKVEVREVDNNNNTNGLSEYNYSISGSLNINAMIRNSTLNHIECTNPVIASIPDIPAGDRGKLMSETHYKQVNGKMVPVSSSNYYYTRDNSTTIWQMLFNQGLGRYLGGYNNEQVFNIYAYQFPIPVLRNLLRHKENNFYDGLGNVSLSQYEDYTYDNVNGHYQLIEKTTQNSKGDAVNTYYKYPQDYGDLSSMSNGDLESQGLKLLQQTHIIVPVETYKEQVKAASGAKTYLGGQINVFSNNLPVINQVYALETATPLTSFTPSSVNNGVFSKNSLYTSRIRFTQYDASGRLLEQSKENDMPHSYIWDYNNLLVIAEVTNGKQSDVAYTSFEADGSGNWLIGSTNRQPGGITGKGCYQAGTGAISKAGLTSGVTYTVSYWTTNADPFTIAGTQGSVLRGKKIGNWTYFEHKVSGVSQVSIPQVTGLIDELRLYPADAQMATYTYDPLTGITSQCAITNTITYYEYDGFKRLKLIRDQDGNIIKTFMYNYKQ